MVTATSLVMYKIGYNPDGKKKYKSVEVAFKNGATQTFEISIVSGEKDIEFQVNKKLPLYDGLAEALGYTSPEKNPTMGHLSLGPLSRHGRMS